MKNVIQDILKMKYFSGSYSDSEHENTVKNIFISHGFKEQNMKIDKKLKLKALGTGKLSLLNNLCFIHQPCGKNNSPDFIVKNNNKLYFIECKSVKNSSSPVYNSGFPNEKYLYIFTSEKYNETTVFYGHQIVSKELMCIYEYYLEKIKILEKELASKLEDEYNPFGLSYYVRDMFVHKGKNGKTNYFLNKERTRIEKEVLNSLE